MPLAHSTVPNERSEYSSQEMRSLAWQKLIKMRLRGNRGALIAVTKTKSQEEDEQRMFLLVLVNG